MIHFPCNIFSLFLFFKKMIHLASLIRKIDVKHQILRKLRETNAYPSSRCNNSLHIRRIYKKEEKVKYPDK